MQYYWPRLRLCHQRKQQIFSYHTAVLSIPQNNIICSHHSFKITLVNRATVFLSDVLVKKHIYHLGRCCCLNIWTTAFQYNLFFHNSMFFKLCFQTYDSEESLGFNAFSEGPLVHRLLRTSVHSQILIQEKISMAGSWGNLFPEKKNSPVTGRPGQCPRVEFLG